MEYSRAIALAALLSAIGLNGQKLSSLKSSKLPLIIGGVLGGVPVLGGLGA
jgi:ribose/xylose/arabinose/galactoside ABC-type transport system permease subunit